jgi:hypothetical protein
VSRWKGKKLCRLQNLLTDASAYGKLFFNILVILGLEFWSARINYFRAELLRGKNLTEENLNAKNVEENLLFFFTVRKYQHEKFFTADFGHLIIDYNSKLLLFQKFLFFSIDLFRCFSKRKLLLIQIFSFGKIY